MNFRGYRMREEPEINFIPLIDVLLVILIFLMVSTTYQRIRELQITLPYASAEKPKASPREVLVGVNVDGEYEISGQRFGYQGVEDFASRLKQSGGDKPEDAIIIINADAKSSHQSVVRVMEAARAAGMAKITFATQEP
ncbi:MAG: biopolymer transporter ExbD [Burkholderiales bacterium]|jgi:biopolymer transport protein ExbD|nr:biopolymer transporter ExbD [Burkholderiales bacterium]